MSGFGEESATRQDGWEQIPEVKLVPQVSEVEEFVARTCEFFFKRGVPVPSSPFKGFLLEGPPGTGKTEAINQVVRRLGRRLEGFANVRRMFVDGASIAAPRWGDAEKALHQVFNEATNAKAGTKVVIHFDDIESLMLARGAELAKEWHYSINSILFHEIDKLDPTNAIICATTNRPDLVDEALRDRLYAVKMPPIPLEQLNLVVKELLDAMDTPAASRGEVERTIGERLREMKSPTIRDARQITVVECIRNRVWSV